MGQLTFRAASQLRHRFLLALGFALTTVLSAAVPSIAQNGQPATLLDGLRDQARPLLIFGGPADPHVTDQYSSLAANAAGVQDRQVRIILVTTTPTPPRPTPPTGTVVATLPQQQQLRSQFHIPQNTFTVILVGKDGGEKFRSTTPISFATLTHLIDAMPMRQQEMRPH